MITISLTERNLLAVNLLLASLFLLGLAYSIKQWHSDWVWAHPAHVLTPSHSTGYDTNQLISAIPEEHLFGKNFSRIGDTPITNLELRVTGIVKVETEQNGAFSKAYISIGGGASKIYQVGDRLPSGVKIYAISPDAVILENEGKLEQLPLPRKRLSFTPQPIKSKEGL